MKEIKHAFITLGPRAQDFTGQQFGRLLILGPIGKDKYGNYIWLCVCDCGKTHYVTSNNLRNGSTKSCGCYNIAVKGLIHGLCSAPEYDTLQRIKARCYNKKNPRYSYYGGRGICVCEGWRNSPVAFIGDIGPRPSKLHSIERIDNNGHYSCGKCSQCIKNGWPANCKWATKIEQASNKRNNIYLTLNGETHTLSGWGRILGIHRGVLLYRYRQGWTVEEILSTNRFVGDKWHGKHVIVHKPT